MRNFLWEGSGEEKKDHVVRWWEVSKPKSLGGLGVGNLVARNRAILGKWLWRFPLENESLWHYIFRSKYGIQINGWDAKEGKGVLPEVHGNLFLKPFTYSFKTSSWGWARGIKSDFGKTCGQGMFHFQLVFRASSIYPRYIILLLKI